jgi:hypothetical protein
VQHPWCTRHDVPVRIRVSLSPMLISCRINPEMSATELIAKFSLAKAEAVSGIAADIAAKVAADGIPALEKNGLMDELQVFCDRPL